MAEMPPSAPPLPRRLGRYAASLLSLGARILLGMFVLWQMIFLPAYNGLDQTEAIRKRLSEERREGGTWWQVVTCVPGLEPLIEEWLNKSTNHDDKGRIGNLLREQRRVVQWWAQTTGQEQGWGLFAPNAVDYSAFPSLELRWDDLERGRAAHEPVVLASANQPRDRRRYLRFGGFRLRRIDSQFEVDTTELSPEQIKGMVSEDSARIRAFLHWRLARFRREHPGLPPPTQ
ncbi:MAG TPA: hypothetical protein VKD72_00150, partial [Gemmataceae bacterium]|nr:hypothetical protein [Gemmataceae bacterium]